MLIDGRITSFNIDAGAVRLFSLRGSFVSYVGCSQCQSMACQLLFRGLVRGVTKLMQKNLRKE